ncbi:MAG TPA: radical SAM protein [Polyangiales bacterium]|nr:radical SAM protein [Polyangiales bacterium]
MLVRLSNKRTGPTERGSRAFSKRVLLAVTPFCSPNFAYPAPAYLARYLRRQGVAVAQADISLELMLKLFSRTGLERIFAQADRVRRPLSESSQRILQLRDRYINTVDTVVGYLQGRDASIAYRLCHAQFLPRGENFERNKGFDWYDGTGNTLAIHDRAKFVGTQYLYDIAGLIREAIFPYFQIGMLDDLHDSFVHWCTTFDAMHYELERAPNIVDCMLDEIIDAHLDSFAPDLVGVSVPFARNLYWSLRIARRARERLPGIRTVAGGGLFNTSMREPSEPRLFQYLDYVTLDDGERPLLCVVEHMEGWRGATELKRTFLLDAAGKICRSDSASECDASHEESGAPDYTDYRVPNYFDTIETINVNQRLYSDGWWNKMTMAHGCYWNKCAFCDIHLSYIKDYETAPAKNLVDKVEECIAQTGHTGFHFVDEAMPPKIMRDFAIELLRRGLNISWHGMMRFDKAYTAEMCKLLAASGLVAIFGGLEVASNRILKLMKKGTSVEQVAEVAKNFRNSGIRVHAFIMYGFPTQTAQETVDALDVVRQLFKYGLVTSASWAKFGVTPHSPIGRDPQAYGIELDPVPLDAFLEQILSHKDPSGADHDKFTAGLTNALKFFGLGMHHDVPVEGWFDFPVPSVSIDRDLVGKVLEQQPLAAAAKAQVLDRRALWLGATPTLRPLPSAEGAPAQAELIFHDTQAVPSITLPLTQANWLHHLLATAQPTGAGPLALQDLEATWNGEGPRFQEFLESASWQMLLGRGLALV